MQVDSGTEWAPRGVSAEWRDKHVVTVIGLSVCCEVVIAPRYGSGRLTLGLDVFLAQYEPFDGCSVPEAPTVGDPVAGRWLLDHRKSEPALTEAHEWCSTWIARGDEVKARAAMGRLAGAAARLGMARDEQVRVSADLVATDNTLTRERDVHDRRVVEWQSKIERLEGELMAQRQCNARHLAAIVNRPDAGKVVQERDELRAALLATNEEWRSAVRYAEEQESRASTEHLRASKARELEEQLAVLRRQFAEQVRLRQEAQDGYVAEARERKRAEAALAADCYACANTPKVQRKVEAQRVALAGLEERNAILTEKVASEQARAEKALSDRSTFLAEVQRLTPKIAALEELRAEPVIECSDWVWDCGNGHDRWDELCDAITRMRAILRSRDVAKGKI